VSQVNGCGAVTFNLPTGRERAAQLSLSARFDWRAERESDTMLCSGFGDRSAPAMSCRLAQV